MPTGTQHHPENANSPLSEKAAVAATPAPAVGSTPVTPAPAPVTPAAPASVKMNSHCISSKARTIPENLLPKGVLEHTEEFVTNVVGGCYVRTTRNVKDPAVGLLAASDSKVFIPGNHFVNGAFVAI